MSAFEKYRVHEVAKDFKTTSKVITQILTDYATTPKNHMQVLEQHELDLIFEYLTQHNQMESLEDLYKTTPKPKEKKSQKPAEAPAARPAEEKPVREERKDTAKKNDAKQPSAPAAAAPKQEKQ